MRKFGRAPATIARAPGRVNLIGEHIDYRGGCVLPMAIERDCVVAIGPGTRGKVRIVANDAPGGEAQAAFDASALAAPTPTAALAQAGIERGSWASYVLGSMWTMHALRPGVTDPVIAEGADIAIASDVPVGAGLSSSAALEIALLRALVGLRDGPWDPLEAAAVGRRAEHEFAGVPCGIMDQIVVAGARADHAMLIDCDVPGGFAPVSADKVQHVPLPPQRAAKVVVIDTRVRHRLADGAYAERVAIATSAAAKLGVRHLCRAPTWNVFALTQLERFATRHSVTEFQRVQHAVSVMMRHDVHALGDLMDQSGSSLRFDERVSCDELDTVVSIAMRGPGCYGVRLTGAGFGGCAVALVWPAGVGRMCERVTREFTTRHGHAPGIIVTRATPGAALV
jgi:galactokinase